LWRPYVTLGVLLMAIYAISIAAYVAFVVYGYRAVAGKLLIIGWTFIAAVAAAGLIGGFTLINLLHLLMQIAIAVEAARIGDAVRIVTRFIRAEVRDLGRVFLVMFGLVAAATLASALAWSGLGLIAFVPLVGLAVFPLQIGAFVVRGLAFEYLGLT